MVEQGTENPRVTGSIPVLGILYNHFPKVLFNAFGFLLEERMDIQIITGVMVKLFTIMALGFLLAKTGIIDKHTNTKLSGLITKVTCPFLVLSSVLSSSADNRLGILKVIMLGFVMYGVFIIFSKIITFVLRFPKKDRPLYEIMLVFSNNAFMGYPVIQSILGTEAIFYTAMIHFAFNIFIFSYGIVNIEKCNEKNTKGGFNFKKLLNPGFILSIFSIIVFVSGFRTNGVIYDTVYMVGNVTSPLSMLVLGASLAMFPLKESISDWRSYLFTAVRLLFIPVITFYVCRMLNVGDFYTTILTITNGMPVASLVLMLGNESGIDTGVIVRNIFVSTVLATFSVPFIVAILF